jgi:metal-sulfur cluster biosynthetic enzyme
MQLEENELRQRVIESLQKVYDPEMPSVSVYDLGLIYKLEVTGDKCFVEHTLTSMACPFADQICNDIEQAMINTEGVRAIDRQLVFEPQFTMEMVPEETKLIMGWY